MLAVPPARDLSRVYRDRDLPLPPHHHLRSPSEGRRAARHLANRDQPVEVVIDREPEELGNAAFQRMATEKPNVTLNRLSAEEMTATMGSIKNILTIGALFAAMGYLLIRGALFLELTQFHPLLENIFSEFTAIVSLAAVRRGRRLH